MQLAAYRERVQPLGGACRRRSEEPFSGAAERLRRWRSMADQVTPFRFFATILGPDGGRRAFRARLGGEADDVLDALAEPGARLRGDRAALAAGLSRLRPRQRGDIKREAEEGAPACGS